MHKVICLMAAFCCLITLSACAKKQQTVIEQTAVYMRAGLENQKTQTTETNASQMTPTKAELTEQPEKEPEERKSRHMRAQLILSRSGGKIPIFTLGSICRGRRSATRFCSGTARIPII